MIALATSIAAGLFYGALYLLFSLLPGAYVAGGLLLLILSFFGWCYWTGERHRPPTPRPRPVDPVDFEAVLRGDDLDEHRPGRRAA